MPSFRCSAPSLYNSKLKLAARRSGVLGDAHNAARKAGKCDEDEDSKQSA